jgi:hypothetical protein
MRFLRSQLAPPDPESTIVEPAPARPLREELLLGQLDLLVALNGALLARAERAEALLAAAAEQHRDLHPLLDRLGVLAGDVLPEVVAQAGELQAENGELARRASRADRDAALLAEALLAPALAAFESGETDNDE